MFPRTIFRFPTLVAVATSAFLAWGCSGEHPTAIAGPTASMSKDQESTPGARVKNYSLRIGEVDLYLDDKAQILHDGLGRETKVPSAQFAMLRTAFARIAAQDAILARLDSDKEYNKCLKEAKERKLKVRASRVKIPSNGSSSFGVSSNAGDFLSASRSATPPSLTGPAMNSAGFEPTYCQAAAMYLYNASSAYRSARSTYQSMIGLSFASGVTILDGLITYDPYQPLQFAAAVALEYAFYEMQSALLNAGIAGTFFHLGGCGQPGAQYGYFEANSGGGTAGLNCITEQVTVEATDEGGNWYIIWSGPALVCS